MQEDKILRHDPLGESDSILAEDFYGQPSEQRPASSRHDESRPRRRRAATAKPTHYKVICISMYTQDIEELEAKVAELKRRGYTKANKSQLIRMALSRLDVEDLQLPPR